MAILVLLYARFIPNFVEGLVEFFRHSGYVSNCHLTHLERTYLRYMNLTHIPFSSQRRTVARLCATSGLLTTGCHAPAGVLRGRTSAKLLRPIHRQMG